MYTISNRVTGFLERGGILEFDEENSYLNQESVDEDPAQQVLEAGQLVDLFTTPVFPILLIWRQDHSMPASTDSRRLRNSRSSAGMLMNCIG